MFGACIRRQNPFHPQCPLVSRGCCGVTTFRFLSGSSGSGSANAHPHPQLAVNRVGAFFLLGQSGGAAGRRGEFRPNSLIRNYSACSSHSGSASSSSSSLVLGKPCREITVYQHNSQHRKGDKWRQLVLVRYKGGYGNFGHNPPDISGWTVLWLGFLVSVFIGCWIDWKYIGELVDWVKSDKRKKVEFPKVDAAEVSKHDSRDKIVGKEDDGPEDVPATKKPGKQLGFRDRKIIEYENRIRQYSTPDKTFRYFATLQVIQPTGENEVFMTPDDFLRSITPGIKQPEGLGLDQFKRYDPKLAGRLELELDPDSIFYRLGSHGLISFSDYVFLLTVLSTSRRHFEIAFRMFDLNGDGDVDVEEFEKVTALIRQRTSVGARHREMSVSQNSLRETNSALNSYFFGATRRDKLTIEKFLEFQQQLQTEILNLEFRRKGPDDNGSISESDFSELLLAYAGYPAKRKARMLKRVKKKCMEPGYATGVSLDDYLKFFHLLSNIQDVDTALTFYHIAGAAIDPITLKHVARTVAHVELSDHIINVVFTLFDENQDGQLSNREFVAVMKNRLMRGLEKPKDTGFFKLLTSIGRCAKESLPR